MGKKDSKILKFKSELVSDIKRFSDALGNKNIHHESQKSDELHPVYHLQYNNEPKKFESEDTESFDYGQLMAMDTPRFIHYPLELILGLSFLIANFQPSKYSELLKDPDFFKIVQKYQEKIWKPYFYTMSSFWQDINRNWSPDLLCPYLV